MSVPSFRTLVRVTIPMCKDALFEIAVFFFVNAMVTISAVVFLYPADFKLASVAIVNMEDAGDTAPAAALSVLVILINIAVRLVYEFVSGRKVIKAE
jgi:iron(III) transport system permease protein